MTNFKKIIIYGGLASILSIVGVTYVLNKHMKDSIENTLNNFNGFTAPEKNYLEGLSLHFDKATCSGLLSYKCEAKNLRVHAKNKNDLNEDILVAGSMELNSKDFEFNQNEKRFKVSVKDILPVERLRDLIKAKFEDKEIEKLNAEIFSQLFPMNFDLDVNIKKGLGYINFVIDNKSLTLDLGAFISVNQLKETFKISIDRQGNIIKDFNQTIELAAEYNTNQMFNSSINSMHTIIKNKEIPELLYNLYSLNMKVADPARRGFLNDFVLEKNSPKELSFNEVKDQLVFLLTRLSLEMPYPIFHESIAQLAESIKSKKEINLFLRNKTNITNEEFSLLMNFFENDGFKKMEIIDNNFELKKEVK